MARGRGRWDVGLIGLIGLIGAIGAIGLISLDYPSTIVCVLGLCIYHRGGSVGG